MISLIYGTCCRVPLKRLEGHLKGVNACGWSPFYKFVCSGGQDRRVILFNPFSQKPLATLLGHNAGIIEVAINDRENQIISLSSDKCVKVMQILTWKSKEIP